MRSIITIDGIPVYEDKSYVYYGTSVSVGNVNEIRNRMMRQAILEGRLIEFLKDEEDANKTHERN